MKKKILYGISKKLKGDKRKYSLIAKFGELYLTLGSRTFGSADTLNMLEWLGVDDSERKALSSFAIIAWESGLSSDDIVLLENRSKNKKADKLSALLDTVKILNESLPFLSAQMDSHNILSFFHILSKRNVEIQYIKTSGEKRTFDIKKSKKYKKIKALDILIKDGRPYFYAKELGADEDTQAKWIYLDRIKYISVLD